VEAAKREDLALPSSNQQLVIMKLAETSDHVKELRELLKDQWSRNEAGLAETKALLSQVLQVSKRAASREEGEIKELLQRLEEQQRVFEQTKAEISAFKQV